MKKSKNLRRVEVYERRVELGVVNQCIKFVLEKTARSTINQIQKHSPRTNKDFQFISERIISTKINGIFLYIYFLCC